MIKQQITVVGIPLFIQLALGSFFTFADLGERLKSKILDYILSVETLWYFVFEL